MIFVFAGHEPGPPARGHFYKLLTNRSGFLSPATPIFPLRGRITTARGERRCQLPYFSLFAFLAVPFCCTSFTNGRTGKSPEACRVDHNAGSVSPHNKTVGHFQFLL